MDEDFPSLLEILNVRVSPSRSVINALIGFAPQIAGEVLKEHTNYDDMVVLDSNSKKMIEYAKQLNNPRLTATEKQVINGEIQKLNTESTKVLKKTIKNNYAGYKITSIDEENDKDRTAYEIKLEKGDAHARILVDKNGKILKKDDAKA
jgi:uncharacterized membrane protein YkoI